MSSEITFRSHISLLPHVLTHFAAIIAAISVAYRFSVSEPTFSGMFEFALLVPISLLLLVITPAAWFPFFTLPVIAIFLSIIGFKEQSRPIQILAVCASFAAVIANAFWIETLTGV
jgi:hypothetical protein